MLYKPGYTNVQNFERTTRGRSLFSIPWLSLECLLSQCLRSTIKKKKTKINSYPGKVRYVIFVDSEFLSGREKISNEEAWLVEMIEFVKCSVSSCG